MLLNTVFFDTEEESHFRIIYETYLYLWVMDLSDHSSWPEQITLAQFEAKQLSGIFIQSEDPYRQSSQDLTESDIKIRDEAYQAIMIFLDGSEAMYLKKDRNLLIKKAMELSSRSRVYIKRQLKRYWQRGLSRNAVIPDLKNAGAKGKLRRNAKVKVGAKRIYSAGVGVVITDEIAELFKIVIENKFLKNGKLSLIQTYRNHFIGIYRSRFPQADETEIPTRAQFIYYYRQNYKKNDVLKKRIEKKIHDKDIRALVSTSTFMNIGPGGRYEIDASIGDIYLVSEKNPEKIIGRPTIYYVRDVFSRMITGLYVGLENPSWVAAMIAMTNAFSNKVAFCAKYDISIITDEWPCNGLPASIMADKGELLSSQADVIVNALDIQLSNSRSYRGDDKGGVESLFRTTQAEFKPYADGIVEPVNGVKRLGKDYRLDATMNIHQFTKMMILIVLQKNNKNVIENYDFSEDMPAELSANPRELWDWGIQYRTGRLKLCDEEFVRLNLLPHGKGTISDNGIKFKHMSYTCVEALQLGWFDRNKQIRKSRPDSVDISFDPRSTNTVYLRYKDNIQDFWKCNLADRSRRLKNMSFADAGAILKISKIANKKSIQKNDFQSPDYFNEINNIIEEANANKINSSKKTKSEKLSNIKRNRHEEKKQERSVLYKESSDQPPENVVSINQENNEIDGYLYPNLDKYLDDD